jgi:pyruvate dehydrogenase E1 component alpha subunit
MTTKTPVKQKAPEIDREHLLHLLQKMVLIRRFEEKTAEMYQQSKVRGFLHLYIGEEAIAVGVMEALGLDDSIFATYREHGHALARGVSPDAIMAEMYGKYEGTCRGRGGSMHIFDAKTRFFGGNGIVAGHLPMAVGVALADKKRGRKNVTTCFFGDGATPEGEFHESLNLAALLHTPVLFICENNLYCMGTPIAYHSSNTNISLKPPTYNIPAVRVDGMDVLAVEAATKKAVEYIRNEGEPYFIEFLTYRFRPHSMFDAELYRTKAEVEEWKIRDPIPTLIQYMKEHDAYRDADLAIIEKDVAAVVQHAVDFAEAGTLEPVEELTRFVYTERKQP